MPIDYHKQGRRTVEVADQSIKEKNEKFKESRITKVSIYEPCCDEISNQEAYISNRLK